MGPATLMALYGQDISDRIIFVANKTGLTPAKVYDGMMKRQGLAGDWTDDLQSISDAIATAAPAVGSAISNIIVAKSARAPGYVPYVAPNGSGSPVPQITIQQAPAEQSTTAFKISPTMLMIPGALLVGYIVYSALSKSKKKA